MPTDDDNKPAGEESAAPKYLTAEDFNKATSAREKRLLGQVEKLFETKLAALAPKAAPAADDDGDEPAPKAAPPAPSAPTADSATQAELKRITRKLELAEQRAAEERKAREEQTAKAARDEERGKLSELLSGAGVSGAKLKAAVALLHTEEKAVRRNADGKIVFVDAEGDEQDVTTGVRAWLASDDGKAFLPPRGATGAGFERGNASPAVARTGNAKADRKAEAMSQLAAAFFGQRR